MTLSSAWPFVTLSEAVEFLDGRRRPVKVGDRAKMRGHIPYYGASGVVDFVNDHLFDEELILLGEDGENILSRVVPLAFKITGKSWVNNHAHVLRPRPDFDIDFLTAYLESLDYSGLNSGTAQPKLNKQSCSSIQVVKPPLPEQRSIAAVIRDSDLAIASLRRIIGKKQAIKQGMMQQLLTGKTRLPGFERDCRTETIRTIVETPVTDGPHLTPQFLQAGVPFLSVNNLVHGKIDWSDVRYISRFDHREFSRKCAPRRDDILLGKAASVGKVAIVESDVEFNIWSPLAMIRVAKTHCPKFVYFQMQSASILNQIELLTNTSSQGNIGMGDIERLRLPIPPLDEQIAIADVLSTVDAEVDALRRRLRKAQMVKQGVVQELLTGRTRLGPTEVTA